MIIQTLIKRFFEGKLPDRSRFYSFLKDKCISEKDYLHAINILEYLKKKNNGWLS